MASKREYSVLILVISMGATLLVVKPRFLFGEYQQNAAVQADERVIGFSVMATVLLLFGVDGESIFLPTCRTCHGLYRRRVGRCEGRS